MPAADLTMDLTARSQTSHARRGAVVQHEASRFNFERAGGHPGPVVGPRAGLPADSQQYGQLYGMLFGSRGERSS
jgi:hypothetical protein